MSKPNITPIYQDITIKPYDYQQVAIEKMRAAPYFLLADEMGLGKTVELLCEVRDAMLIEPKVLIIAPKSAMSVWEDHVAWILPELPVMSLTSTQRAKAEDFTYGVLIINPEALSKMYQLLVHHWDYIIADECHLFKNRKTKRSKALKKLRAKRKRAASGTPLVNKPDELWSILNWLNPRQYRSYWRFFEKYVKYITDPAYGYKIIIGAKNVDELRGEISPFMLRRLKQEVLKDLPEKYYTMVKVDLGSLQMHAYRQMKKESLAWLATHDPEQPLEAPTVLAQLTRLRQFADAYAKFDDDYGKVQLSEPSSKLDAMMDILEDTDQPVVIFSQFEQMISLASRRIEKLNIGFAQLTGKTPQAARGGIIKQFQEGRGKVLLATMQTGGVGITLTAASTAIFLDRSWSPAMNLQAEDRLHRVGQKNAVQIINIQARGTVDEKVEKKLEWKWNMIKEILGDE